MPGIADLLYLGQPNPSQEIARMLSGQQPQPPGQQGAGPQQGPNPLPPNGPAPAPGQPGQPQPLTPGQQTPPGPNSPPTPLAYQSSPDMQSSYQQLAQPPNLMSLYLQLDARDRAEDQINKGFALIAANHAGNPGMARAIMDSVSGGAGNAGGTVSNLLSLYQAQQGMAAQQSMLGQTDAIAQKLGLDSGIVRAEILAGRGPELIQALEPTTKTRDIQAEHDIYIKSALGQGQDQTTAESNWNKYYLPMIMTGGMSGVTPEMRSRTSALIKWQTNPANQGKTPPAFLTDDQKWDLYGKDMEDARTQFPGMNQNLTNVIGKLSDVSNNTALDNITGGVMARGTGFLKGLAAGTPEYNLHNDLTGLGNLTAALAKRGGPKGVGENLTSLGASPDDFTNYGIGDFRNNVIAPKMKLALEALANSYGAAGQTDQMPGYLKPYLDKMFQPGGDRNPGVDYKPFTPNQKLKQLTPQDMADFQNAMEHYGPEKALAHLEAKGYDTSALR